MLYATPYKRRQCGYEYYRALALTRLIQIGAKPEGTNGHARPDKRGRPFVRIARWIPRDGRKARVASSVWGSTTEGYRGDKKLRMRRIMSSMNRVGEDRKEGGVALKDARSDHWMKREVSGSIIVTHLGGVSSRQALGHFTGQSTTMSSRQPQVTVTPGQSPANHNNLTTTVSCLSTRLSGKALIGWQVGECVGCGFGLQRLPSVLRLLYVGTSLQSPHISTLARRLNIRGFYSPNGLFSIHTMMITLEATYSSATFPTRWQCRVSHYRHPSFNSLLRTAYSSAHWPSERKSHIPTQASPSLERACSSLQSHPSE